MPDVFLSYSRDDQATARRFAEGFEREGISVWWDQTLHAGEDYDEVTEKALEGAKAVVVLWSKKSVVSRWVRAEATQADRNGTLVPAMIEPCKRPIMFELKQTADLSEWTGDLGDAAWQSYLASVRRLVEKGGTGRPAAPVSVVVKPGAQRISPGMIATGVLALLVIGVGLWWFAQPRSETVAQTPVPPSPPATTNAAQPSVAVLPFDNMSSDPEQEYFSDGLSEELLNQLAKVPELRVIGRTSSFAFKGKKEDLRKIGETLGVNHILQGSVRKADKRVKITAQLIRTSDGSQLWSDTYARTLEDVFAIQEEIAQTVSRELQVRMGTSGARGSGTTNVEAYEAFLAGRALLSRFDSGSMRAAIPHLERAVSIDPDFLPAWLWLADAYTRAALNDRQAAAPALSKQNEAIDRVIALAPGSPEASFALSYRVAYGRDLQQLGSLMRDSLKLTGSQGARARMRYAQFLLSVGLAKQAAAELERAKNDEPLDSFVRVTLLQAYEATGDDRSFELETQQLVQLFGGRTPTIWNLELSRAMGRRDEAGVRSALVALGAENGGPVPDVLGLMDQPGTAKRELASRLADPRVQTNIYGASGIAQWAAWFGEKEIALDALEAARLQGFSFETWAWIVWRPVMREIWSEPRFKKLVREVGLVDYWSTTGNWGDFCKPVGEDDFECR